MTDLDAEWEAFQNQLTTNNQPNYIDGPIKKDFQEDIPKCSDIYISTQTKINIESKIDLEPIFWNLPVIDYYNLKWYHKSIKMIILHLNK